MQVGNRELAIYQNADFTKISELEARHEWIVAPIFRASALVSKMPFYDHISRMRSPMEFKPIATQLYFHSATFPKVMGLMLGLTPISENYMMPFYAKHAFGEADHHQMLLRWMLRHKIIASPDEIDATIIGLETNACINLAYRLAAEQDRDKWLAAINSGIERCSNDFFKAVAPKMREIGAGDAYFDIHVEADEHHSIMGLDFIQVQDPSSVRARHILAKALEGIALWADMIHSWIGVDYHPRFNLDGSLISSPPH
ncbi:iron-containing redox enzyme family protein [Methylocapsa acidiphila]|uniref:iron-containing redox enzyme family protein n=1 Tax=Methylocapsa acidiphila TaxID=133552 RepID=UPI000A04CEA0|nr:iron-containing redox enzyme family protein [Methylocapsa acidiphila]